MLPRYVTIRSHMRRADFYEFVLDMCDFYELYVVMLTIFPLYIGPYFGKYILNKLVCQLDK